MLHYKSSQQTTAQKTNQKRQILTIPTMEQIRSENTIGSPSKGNYHSSKLNQIRGSIQQIINDVAKKAHDNKEAIEEVKHVNNDLIDHLDGLPERPTSMENLVENQYESPVRFNVGNVDPSVSVFAQPSFHNNRMRNQTQNFNYSPIPQNYEYDLYKNSSAQFGSPKRRINYDVKQPYVNGFSDFKRNQRESVVNQQLLRQNEHIKKLLNEQIRKNNQLIKRCQFLEMENERLRLLHYNPSTNYQERQSKARYFGSPSTNLQKSSYHQNDLINQLNYLKSQNQRLRRDSIKLLKKI